MPTSRLSLGQNSPLQNHRKRTWQSINYKKPFRAPDPAHVRRGHDLERELGHYCLGKGMMNLKLFFLFSCLFFFSSPERERYAGVFIFSSGQVPVTQFSPWMTLRKKCSARNVGFSKVRGTAKNTVKKKCGCLVLIPNIVQEANFLLEC